MNVYAQPTDLNWRLCSLLSAVLNRSLRPDFVAAIESTADTLHYHHHHDTTTASPRPHLALVFVGPSSAIERLAQRTPKFSREFELDIATVPVRVSPNAPVTSLRDTLQTLQKSIQFFAQTGRPVVLVSIASGVDVVHQLFLQSSTTALNGNVLGMVAVDPPHCQVLAANSVSAVPTLVILSWNEEQLVDKDRQLYLRNPHVILVQHNHQDIYGIDWQNSNLELDGTSSDDVSLHQTYMQWLVRTIAKFSEAVAKVHQTTTKTKEQRSDQIMILHQLPNIVSKL